MSVLVMAVMLQGVFNVELHLNLSFISISVCLMSGFIDHFFNCSGSRSTMQDVRDVE